MIEWYTPDHLPQPNIPLLAYYGNTPQFPGRVLWGRGRGLRFLGGE